LLVVSIVFVARVVDPLSNDPPEIILHPLRYLMSVRAGAFGIIHTI
jgi:hypothetical protein